jgi:hypothetical protein
VLIRRVILGSQCAEDLAQVYEQFGLSVPSHSDFPEDPERPLLDGSVYSHVVIVGRPSEGPAIPSQRPPIAL